MGLDMYLTAKRYLWSIGDHPDVKIAEQIAALFPELTSRKRFGQESSPVQEVIAEAIYWRKANAIHKWFVDNVQDGNDDCGNYYVDREQLQALADLCREVIADNSKAATLLPAQAGFFFGDTTYGEYYIQDLEHTVESVDKALALPDAWNFEYHSSW